MRSSRGPSIERALRGGVGTSRALRGTTAIPRPAETKDRKGATPNGRLTTPPLDSVRAEIERARPYFTGSGKLRLVVSGDGHGLPGSEPALQALLESLGVKNKLRPSGSSPEDLRGHFDPSERLRRQFNQLVDYTQTLVRRSPARRAEFWSKADASSPERWKETTRFHRDYKIGRAHV